MLMKRSYIASLCAVAMLAACASTPAAADTVTATWVNPVQNTDGSDIPASGEGSLASARIAWGTCTAAGTFGTEAGFIVRTQPVAAAVFNLKPGNWCVYVSVANTYGESSDPSNVVAHISPPTKPRQATGVSVVRQPAP